MLWRSWGKESSLAHLVEEPHDLEVLRRLEEGVQSLLFNLCLALIDKVQDVLHLLSRHPCTREYLKHPFLYCLRKKYENYNSRSRKDVKIFKYIGKKSF
jgi:hypothetical protein